jgi:CHAT domain-containing protein
MLVSHRYVNSEATVALIKGAFGELKAAPEIGRAEALRRSMLSLIDKRPERFAHPAAWPPFVVRRGSDWKYGGHERKYQTGSSEIILGAGSWRNQCQ